MTSGSLYACLAGLLGASSSLLAKLSLGAEHLVGICEASLSGWSGAQTATCTWLHLPLRLLCGALLLTSNTVMWNVFSKALRHCSSSATATVTTTATNFITSAALGRWLFGETQAPLWWFGITLTLCGLLVLHGSSPQDQTKKER